jgi:hypothetical protein
VILSGEFGGGLEHILHYDILHRDHWISAGELGKWVRMVSKMSSVSGRSRVS